MAYLRDIAQGLRSAAGVLNPEVQKQTFNEDSEMERMQRQFAQTAEMQRRQFEMQQSTPQAQLAREQLENERGFREAVRGSGGDITKIASAAAQYGKPEIAVNIFNQQEARQARLQQAREALEAKKSELEMRMQDRQASREQQALFQRESLAIRQQSVALQAQIATGNQELQKLRIEMMVDKKQREVEREKLKITQNLGAAFEKANLPQMDAVLKNAEASVLDDKVLEYINGPKSSVPDFAVSKDITNARQAIDQLFNITLKDRSGAAVTIPELERLKNEFGRGVFKKPGQLREAVSKARGIVENHYRGIAAGFGKSALDDYNKNMEEIGGTPVLRGGGTVPPPPPGFKVN
jgi:hypothetical protein